MIVLTRSAEETEKLGERIGAQLKPGDTLALLGELGAGKTTFVKGLARALSISDPIRSPTFTLIHEHRGNFPLAHIDLYRLEDPQAIVNLALDEIYDQGITVLEWAERANGLLPPERLEIRIETVENEARRFNLTAHGERFKKLVAQLEADE